jgi:hypothetical protein
MNRHLRKIFLAALMAVVLLPARAGSVDGRTLDEEFRYQWQLRNFLGSIAGLFLPNQGEGSLTFKKANGHLKSELTITSHQSREGEFFKYGSEVDAQTMQPIRVWSSYQWRGETKSKNEPVGKDGVLDVASGIFAIRNNPPDKTRRMEIWSDGRIYPVVVIPLGVETRKLPRGQVQARHYSIRGIDVPGRNRWKGKLDLWLSNDAAATPVEILISRNLADVRLQILSQS